MRDQAGQANVRGTMSEGLDELYQVSQAVLSVTRQMSVRDVLQVIVRSARSLVGARYAALGVPDAGDSFAEFVVDGVSDAEWAAIGPLPRRHGMLAVLLNQGKPERLADIRKDPRFEGWPAAHPKMSHFLGVPVRDEIEVVGGLGAEAHAELRAVIDGLAPPDLEAAGLAESLRRYAVLAGRAHGVPVTFTAACLPPLGEKAEAALYRVAQEALHNALRHAGASGITVTLSKTPRLVVLEVSD